ncbi:FMN-binding negative transcriptional regulator [Brevibacillus sp. FSL K6-2834]|uniref:FMN-binding negative transcriptional regulator n=1 Tax=Brevibacillus sp. FSL K6-2834 TaxID=2954680 RepID=UPI003158DFD2
MNVYIPKQYRMNHDEAVQMMKSYPFALLITVDEQRPLATHIPLEIREEEGKIYATGHIAYGNIQKKTLDHNRDVLLIFQGPHAYISSSWYEREEVPTWDYLAVHAYGTSRVLEKDELKSALDSMLKRYCILQLKNAEFGGQFMQNTANINTKEFRKTSCWIEHGAVGSFLR